MIERQSGTPASVTPGSEILDVLNELLRLDHDAIGSYEIAIEHLVNRGSADQIEAFKGDHERHILRLNELVYEYGGVPANEPNASSPLTQAIQKLAGVGGDEGLLLAWRANEHRLLNRYRRYVRRARGWPEPVRALIDEHAADEERHYAWVLGLLEEAREPSDTRLDGLRQIVLETRARVADFVAHEVRTNPARGLISIFVVGFVAGRLIR